MWLVMHSPYKPTDHDFRYQPTNILAAHITFFSDLPKGDEASVVTDFEKKKKMFPTAFSNSVLFYVESFK